MLQENQIVVNGEEYHLLLRKGIIQKLAVVIFRREQQNVEGQNEELS